MCVCVCVCVCAITQNYVISRNYIDDQHHRRRPGGQCNDVCSNSRIRSGNDGTMGSSDGSSSGGVSSGCSSGGGGSDGSGDDDKTLENTGRWRWSSID